MLWTLQKYIFREMGKTFLLTAVGLVAVLGLGGGVMNIIELEGITALQLLKIMALVLPVSAALTLPVAALYSATVTYGRLSADNELVACRSGGINIHILLLPTLVFSLISAICSFFFINFLIPGMVMNIDRFIGTDVPRLIAQRLASPERLSLNGDRYQIFADRFKVRESPKNGGSAGPARLELSGVAFMEMGKQRWARFGTAERVSIGFDIGSDHATIAADMYDLTMFDYGRGWFEEGHFPIGRYELPNAIPVKVKWLTLGDLIQYRRQPLLFPEIARKIARLRGHLARSFYYEALRRQWKTNADRIQRYGEVTIGDAALSFVVQSVRLDTDPQDGHLNFTDHVTVIERRNGQTTRTVQCERAVLEADKRERDETPAVYLAAYGQVSIVDTREPDVVTRRDKERFDPVELDESILQQAAKIPAKRLLAPDADGLRLSEDARKRQRDTIVEVNKLSREIIGVLHSRLAFSLSVFVLVILGAVLGIVFRGAHTLTAFGISFVPSLFVICTIIMGRQMVQNPAGGAMGIAVIWLGIVIVAVVDGYVLMRVLRR